MGIKKPYRPNPGHAWCQAHWGEVMEHPGEWLAVGGDGILATGATMDEVYRGAREKGNRNPVVFKVPSRDRGIQRSISKARFALR